MIFVIEIKINFEFQRNSQNTRKRMHFFEVYFDTKLIMS